MRLFKLAFISLIFLFLLITGISLFIPSRVRVSRAINILASRDSILAQIKDPAKWKNWYPGMDTAKLLLENGEVKGVILDNSNSDRPVTIAITRITSDEVTARFSPKKLKPVTYTWKAISHQSTDSITLHWYMEFNLRWYPWEKFGSMLIEKSNGSRMEEGLTNIRDLLHE